MTNKIIVISGRDFFKRLLLNNLDRVYNLGPNRGHIGINDEEYEINNYLSLSSPYALIKEEPALVVQCADSTRLESSLLLTAQILETGIPLVISVNIVEETLKNSVWIKYKKLQSLLGVPVVETIVSQNIGIKKIFDNIESALDRGAHPIPRIRYKSFVEETLEDIGDCFADNPPSRAVLVLLMGESSHAQSWVAERYGYMVLKAVKKEAAQAKKKTLKDPALAVLESRQRWAANIFNSLAVAGRASRGGFSEKIGWLARHQVWGWPMLAGFVYFAYLLVGKIAAGKITWYVNSFVFYPVFGFLRHNVTSDFLRDFLIGP